MQFSPLQTSLVLENETVVGFAGDEHGGGGGGDGCAAAGDTTPHENGLDAGNADRACPERP